MRLNGTGEALDSHEYPATSDELIDQYGDHEIEIPEGSATLSEVLGRLETDTYADARSVREALFCAVGHEAIGRRHYSDRDPGTPGETHGREMLSF